MSVGAHKEGRFEEDEDGSHLRQDKLHLLACGFGLGVGCSSSFGCELSLPLCSFGSPPRGKPEEH